MLFTMRVSVPDRPGTLGSLATALSNGGANIVALDVIDHEEGFAIDDLIVEAPEGIAEALRHAAERTDGAIVEAIRPLPNVSGSMNPMELAATLVDTRPEHALQTLVDGLPGALWSTWCAALRGGRASLDVIAASPAAASISNMDAPWLPLENPRRFAHALWMPPAWRMGRLGYEVAAAPLADPMEAILLVRRHGPRFRSSELHQLSLLARIAVAVRGRDDIGQAPVISLAR